MTRDPDSFVLVRVAFMNYDYMIYPKQFRAAKIPIEKNRCFFLMPFSDAFDIIYGTVKDILMGSGYTCNRVDEITDSKPIVSKILVEILKAQYIIVDLTGCNPNVFYELGITHTFKDSQNVLLIKQKDTVAPFDIKHLQYREYSPNNLKQLAAIIRDFISKNQRYSEFHEALNVHGVIGLIHDNQEDFVNYLNSSMGEDIVTLTSILNFKESDVPSESIGVALDRYATMVHKVIDSRRMELLPGVLKLYTELLISCSSLAIAELHVSIYLGSFFAQHNLSYSEISGYQTDLVVALAEKRKMLTITLPWIIGYFSKSKAASIDLNRYKLEALLMTSDAEEINRTIVNSIFSNDCHIREHMADIIGEKQLHNAGNVLCRQLLAETNYYTAVSIIEAIGKLDYETGLVTIEEWLAANEQNVIESKMYTVFRHAQNAIIRLDHTHDGTHRTIFAQKYAKYITENVPL